MSQLEMFGQTLDLSGYAATVVDVQQWTETHVNSHGGGGYIHPQFGGYVEAPKITSRSTRHQRVRFKFEDGGQQTGLDLPVYIHLSPGDEVALIAAANPVTKKWYWTGIGNATTRECTVLDASSPIIAIRMPSLLAKFGLFIQQCLALGQGGAMVVLFLVAITGITSSVMLRLIISLLLFGKGRIDGDLAMLLGFAAAIALHVTAWRRSTDIIRAENDAAFGKIRAFFQNMPLRDSTSIEKICKY